MLYGGAETVNTSPGVAFDAIHALPGFCQLVKRSATLGGNLPLRAARHCGPVTEGNRAGFQINLVQPMTLRRGEDGVEVDLTPTAFELTQEEVRSCLQRLVVEGILEAEGYWHQLLKRDALPLRGARMHIWTGYLVRPQPGVALRVGRAYNRRSRISVIDHAICDSTDFTPLLLEVDTSDFTAEPRWIDGEIGSLLPVARAAEMTLQRLEAHHPERASVETFFDSDYFAIKKDRPTGKYRRKIRGAAAPVSPTCRAEVLFAGPAVHTLSSLRRFHSRLGLTPRVPVGDGLPFCTVRNIATINAFWDGQTFSRQEGLASSAVRKLRADWGRAGGNTSSDVYEFLRGYYFGPSRDEPYWQLQPWVFSNTAPGWSTVVEGACIGDIDGMRGVIHTDSFHPISMVYRMYAPGPILLRKNLPLMRFFPISRVLQDATMRTMS